MLFLNRPKKLASEDSGAPTSRDERPGLPFENLWRWTALGAALVYLIFTMILGFGSVGLQYDEALQDRGAVHILNFASEPAFTSDKDSWIFFAGRYWPLTIIPYLGAVKDYLLLLPFALFGPLTVVVRAVNALLGALGIWGLAKLLQRETNYKVAAASAFILAINPAYIDQTLYDNASIAIWMASLGVISYAVSCYIKRPSGLTSFLIGIGMGIAIWNRANFVWFLASAFIAAILVFRKSLLIRTRHLATMIGGGLIGLFPLLLYQTLSRLAILRFMRGGQVQVTLASLLPGRIDMLSEVLLSDSEQRSIWGGPPLPFWQHYFFFVVLILSLAACFMLKKGESRKVVAWRRVSALTFILYASVMFTSQLNISEHHFITLVPIAAVVVVLAFQGLIHSWKKADILAISFALVYVLSAVYWNIAAARGLRETGGVNMWSDGVSALNDHLISNSKGQPIKILDWGLQNNLYVLSNAKIESSEIFWGATSELTGTGVPWRDLIARGGDYLTNAGENRHFPEATQGFLAALSASGQDFNRIEFRQKTGRGYAELYRISPLAKFESTGFGTTASGTLTANPNPVVTCDGSGVTTISWTSNGARKIEVRISSPDGALFASASEGPGSWTTGKWVIDGTVFYLQDVSDGRPLTSDNTIATVIARVTREGCP